MQKQIHSRGLARALHMTHTVSIVVLVVAVTTMGFLAYAQSSIWLYKAGASGNAIFAPTSVWNTPLPRYTPAHPDSANLVSDIQRQIDSHSASLDNDDLAAPVYVVDNSVAPVVVDEWDCNSQGYATPGLSAQWQTVPIPSYAEPATSPEAGMVVYQPATQTMWEFFGTRKVAGQWQACGGGRIQGTASHDGRFANPFGSTATGLPVIGGQISLSELQTGSVNHAIGLTLAEAEDFMNYSWPAARSDGTNPGAAAHRLPEGLRFRLDPSLNVDSLGLHPIARAIARAAQSYGFVVWGTGNGVAVQAEHPKSQTTRGLPDPYQGLLAGASEENVLDGFPWHKLQALPSDYGQDGIIPAINSFVASKNTVDMAEPVTLSWQATNVDSCTVAGGVSGQGAVGSWQSQPLRNNTTFSLICGGIAGSISQQVTVSVQNTSQTPVPPDGEAPVMLAEAPVVGLANIIPELYHQDAVFTVQKVEYFERSDLIHATTKPPYSLDTTQLSDGPHVLHVTVTYRDGHSEQKVKTITVANRNLPLILAPAIGTGSDIPKILLGASGGFLSAAVMAAAVWRGLLLTRLS